MPRVVIKRLNMSILSFQRKIRRNWRSFNVAVFVTIALLFYKLLLYVFSDKEPLEDVSCHYAHTGNILPVVDCDFYTMPETIYFHYTTCPMSLNSRDACAVESAARANPYWPVVVFVSAPLTRKDTNEPSLIQLDKLWNINFYRLLIDEYASDTKLKDMVKSGALNKSRYPTTQTRDILKFITLSKWGGIALDFNTIVAKPLRGLGRSWAVNSRMFLRTEAMALSRDLEESLAISSIALKLLSEGFQSSRDDHGERVITEAVMKTCHPLYNNGKKCEDFTSLSPSVMANIDITTKEFDLDDDKPYFYRITNLPNDTTKIKVEKDSAYAKLAAKYCPNVYKTFGDNFGM